ncbi:uncharacterized protein VICG_00051 [Vittaforma corneae ATCC 50505]|uniref:SANTA domain-containing protein n=1 Tax=Vittaforma corneae (strain ATCC 50505) TaxID=993615 RepID=L2GPH9_VITCO|nr:uncharacterized protein VICG_00051 [Vittaforma corneae ATCC 50505]ELA42736.1 hypothetical protein VICG_00051 [Vittaforma corneae ATCC 50505]
MENEYIDILHSGALEGLDNYRIFRRRYPSRSSLPVRLITDWYIQEISMPSKKFSKWICLVGVYKDTLIRTSPITSIIAPRRVCTCNCIYTLAPPSKVLQNPFLGVEKCFAEGFPDDWENIVEQALIKTSIVESKENILDNEAKYRMQNQDGLDGNDDITAKKANFDNKMSRVDTNEQLEQSHINTSVKFENPIVENQILNNNLAANSSYKHLSTSESEDSELFVERRSSISVESNIKGIPVDEKIDPPMPEEVLQHEVSRKKELELGIPFFPDNVNVEKTTDTPSKSENTVLNAAEDSITKELANKASNKSLCEGNTDEYAKLSHILNLDLSVLEASESTAKLSGLKGTEASLNDDEAIQDINNMLNEAIGNTNSSASNGFNSYDETLVEKNIKKQSRRRKSLEKGSKYFTVEEFVQNNSPFKLPRAKSSSNNSFEMLNPSNVIQKSLQRSHSISSNDSSFEQSIRSYLKESSGSLNTINNSVVDISNSQAVGHVNASNRKLESLSPRKSVSGMTDNSRQNNEQRNASGVDSMDTIAMPNSPVKIICMNQAPSDSSEGSKIHITLKDTSFNKGSGVRLHSGMQLDIAEVPKEHVNLNLSNGALGVEEKTILKHIGEETKESKDNVQSKRSLAGRLSTNDGLNEQLYDEYFKKIKSEFAEPPLMKNDSSQIAIDIPNIATMHESQTVDIVVDDTIKDLDGAISQSGQDAKAEIPIKMSRESIRKTKLKSFNTGLTPKKPSGTPSPKKSSVVSSTSHSEVDQVNDSHPEANYFCSAPIILLAILVFLL